MFHCKSKKVSPFYFLLFFVRGHAHFWAMVLLPVLLQKRGFGRIKQDQNLIWWSVAIHDKLEFREGDMHLGISGAQSPCREAEHELESRGQGVF